MINVKPGFKDTYIGFGKCHACKKKRALRESPIKHDGKQPRWVCRRCWESGER